MLLQDRTSAYVVQELLRYLSHVRVTWKNITTTNILLDGSQVDSTTVTCLQALAPSASRNDRASIRTMMKDRTIFPKVEDDAARDVLLDNILAHDGLLPSLYTFFENLKYLEPCCKILRELVLADTKTATIRSSLQESYNPVANFTVEYGEYDSRPHPSTDPERTYDLAYWQLWLFTMRNFPDLTAAAPRKEARTAKPTMREPNPALWQRLGELAVNLGFRTKTAVKLRNEDAHTCLATRLIEQCGSAPLSCQEEICRIAEVAKKLRYKKSQTVTASLTSEAKTHAERRVGRPFEQSHELDRGSLFLPFLGQTLGASAERGHDITTFYCIRDIIINFLGVGQVSWLCTLANQILTERAKMARFDAAPSIDEIHMNTPVSTPGTCSGTCTSISQLEERLSAQSCRAEAAEGRIRSMQATLDESQSEMDRLRSLHEQDKSRIGELQAELRAKEDEQQSLREHARDKQLADYGRDFFTAQDEANTTVRALRAQITDYQKQLPLAKQTIDRLQREKEENSILWRGLRYMDDNPLSTCMTAIDHLYSLDTESLVVVGSVKSSPQIPRCFLFSINHLDDGVLMIQNERNRSGGRWAGLLGPNLRRTVNWDTEYLKIAWKREKVMFVGRHSSLTHFQGHGMQWKECLQNQIRTGDKPASHPLTTIALTRQTNTQTDTRLPFAKSLCNLLDLLTDEDIDPPGTPTVTGTGDVEPHIAEHTIFTFAGNVGSHNDRQLVTLDRSRPVAVRVSETVRGSSSASPRPVKIRAVGGAQPRHLVQELEENEEEGEETEREADLESRRKRPNPS